MEQFYVACIACALCFVLGLVLCPTLIFGRGRRPDAPVAITMTERQLKEAFSVGPGHAVVRANRALIQAQREIAIEALADPECSGHRADMARGALSVLTDLDDEIAMQLEKADKK